MSIDYKGEVDSGFDRKRIVESAIISCLKEGIPLDIIKNCKYFQFRHNEMLYNLKKNYEAKVLEIARLYNINDIESVVVPDNFAKVSHPVGGELYPMNQNEEIASFKRMRKLETMIDKHKVTTLEKDLNLCEKELEEYINNNLVINSIIEFVNQIEIEEKESNSSVTFEKMQEIALNFGLDSENLFEYNLIYEEYKKLYDKLVIAKQKFNEITKEEKKDINMLKRSKELLEEEIIKRNTKMVNWFIRANYGKLLVESDDLFQICYLGLALAVRGFDYEKGFKFSTYAYKVMDNEVKRNFEELTGQTWDCYWARKNIIHLLKYFKDEFGNDVSIEYLDRQGLLPVTIEQAYTLLKYTYTLPFAFDFPNSVPIEEVIDEDSKNLEDIIDERLLVEELKDGLSELTDREVEVLYLRYGFIDENQCTYRKIGEKLGISKDSIHNIEAKAIRNLRSNKFKEYLKSKNFRTFLGY